MNISPVVECKNQPDLIVLSDLHLGEGLRNDEPRYQPTEDFFHDLQFARFLDHLQRQYARQPDALKLVLNGDTFDFLTVTSVPDEEEAAKRGFRISTTEAKFGLDPTPKKSIYKLDRIMAGHGTFFRALAGFVTAGFRVEILQGNHDMELYFPEVKERILAHLGAIEGSAPLAQIRERVRFHPWFYQEPGRIYIEHGNQYDANSSVRYLHHPVLPESKRAGNSEEVLDYPLGSIFVRFFYNRVRQLDPYSPRMVSFDHYLAFIKRYNLFDVWRVYKDHYPHFIGALGTSSIGGSGPTEEEESRRDAFFEQLSADGGGDLHRKLHKLMISPISASKVGVVAEMMSAVVRRGLRLGLLVFIAIFAWFGILQLIDLVPGVTANAFLMSLFAVATLAGALTVWIHLDRKLRRRAEASEVGRLSDRAAKIAAITKVKMVCMGHTHMVEFRRINDGDAVYANSGTWTSIDNPWSRFMRDARRLTFLYVRGDAVELLRWNDDAYRFDPVPLFQLETMALDRVPSSAPLEISDGSDISLAPPPPYSIDEGE